MPLIHDSSLAQIARLPRPRRRRRVLGLMIEPLEQRQMLDGSPAGLPSSIVVGRSLSSYFVGDIQNHQETITYTVYNEQANPETGVFLTTTLAPGVTFASASVLPDQSGQHLAWSLGTIQGFGRASVTLTVNLASTIPTTLDTGAQVFATLDAAPVSDTTPAAALRAGTIDPALLASTADANTTDPFIQEEAAKLDYDPQRIFDDLHTQVSYNSYSGSLQGARGTLWSRAGNALDVASLGVALMRASGVPAQYVQGNLSFSQAQQLILSMFPTTFQTIGDVAPGTPTANPANDGQLLTETEDHYWFQFDTGGGMQDADPLMAGATIGQSFTTSSGSFNEVPDDLRQKVEVKLNAELYFPGFAGILGALGSISGSTGVPGTSSSTVLDLTFNTVDLVGRPISIGNFVSSEPVPTLFSPVINTYSPYLAMGDLANADPSQLEITRGTDYQEILSGFPLANQVLTGLFLSLTLTGPNRSPQTIDKTLFDRFGYALRQGLGGPTNLAIDPSGDPAIRPTDLVSLAISPSTQPSSALASQAANLATLKSELQAAVDASSSTSLSPNLETLNRRYSTLSTAALASYFLALSDQQVPSYDETFLTRSYFDAPRIVAVSNTLEHDPTTQQATLSTELDILRDIPRVVAAPGQTADVVKTVTGLRGFVDSQIEDTIATQFASQSGVRTTSAYGTFFAAINAGINTVGIDQDHLSLISQLHVSDEAKARITQAVSSGLNVVVPDGMVTINGKATIAWMEIDPDTGATIFVSEDGAHSALVEALYARLSSAFAGSALAEGTIAEGAAFLETGTALEAELLEVGAETGGQGIARNFAFNQAFQTNLRALQQKIATEANPFIKKGLEAILERYKIWGDKFAPPPGPPLSGPPIVDPLFGLAPSIPFANAGNATVVAPTSRASGAVKGSASAASVSVSGQVRASWSSSGTSNAFQVATLSAQGATITAANGSKVGTGSVAFSGPRPTSAAIAGNDQFSVQGTGNLSFYGAAGNGLGVGGNWVSYSATVTGNVSITITTDGLTLNGQAVPAGTYTITATSATLAGSGSSNAPNFTGAATLNVTGGTVNLGPGSGGVNVGGTPLDLTRVATLTGYTGSLGVSAGGNNTDAVTFNGNAAQVLQVTSASAALTTDQNTPLTFKANINSSLADSYDLTAQGPEAWTVAIDSNGNVTVTPAPGLQAGTFPIQIVARSKANPDLVAQTTVDVTVSPTQPGITFSIDPDLQFTVPFNGATIPTAFRATIHNNGPAADTFKLTFPNLPGGFTLINSGTSVKIPAGQTGVLGLYLLPSGQIPAPGTQLSFTVTATSSTDSTITQTATQTFTVPAIDAVTITSKPTAAGSTPGTPATVTITLTNLGNVPEDNITLTSTQSAGLTLSGLAPLSLAVGQSADVTITLTPGAGVSLNSSLQAAITATYGPSGTTRLTQTLVIPVRVTAPGVQPVAAAAEAASAAGDAALSSRLNDLSFALTTLYQNPTDPVARSQATANLDSLITQVINDPFLASFTAGFTAARDAIASATSAADVQAALTAIGNALGSLATAIADEGAHGFTLVLEPKRIVAQPNVPSVFTLDLKNTGSQVTTYDLSVAGLPAGVTGVFSQTKITLNPGQEVRTGSGGPTFTLTETGGTLIPATFTITATAEGASEITNNTDGQLTLRNEVVQIASVSSNPPFVAPGAVGAAAIVEVSAKVQTALNQPQADTIAFRVLDPTGNTVFTSAPTPLALDANSGLVTADLGPFDTSGLAQGSYTIVASIADGTGQPIPGAGGQGTIVVGLPVTAQVTTTPTTVPTGADTVTTTVQVHGTVALPSPLTLQGQVNTGDNELSTVLYGNNLAYVVGLNGVSIVDVTDPTNPTLVKTFAQTEIIKGGYNIAQVVGHDLIVATTVTLNASGFNFIVYDLTDPLNPTLVSDTPINYRFLGDMNILGNIALVTIGEIDFFGSTIFAQLGNTIAIDISDLTKPTVAGVLFNSSDPQINHPEGGAVVVNSQVGYVVSSTSTGGDTQNGVGQLRLLDISNPAQPKLTGTLDIPGTVTLINIALQGNRALVAGSTGGLLNPFGSLDKLKNTGNLTLTVLDTTDPSNPKILGNTLVTEVTFPSSSVPTRGDLRDLGNGLFALSAVETNGKPALLLIDASDPNNIVVSALNPPTNVNGLTVSGHTLYVGTPDGLSIYDIGQLVSQPVSVSVEVPKDGTNLNLVAGSFDKPPTQIISGANFDTYVWNRSLAFGNTDLSFSWQTRLSNLSAGDTRDVTLGTTVGFESQGTPGTLALAGTSVTAAPIIAISPATQTEQPGGSTTYNVRLTNPLDTQVTYYVSMQYLANATGTFEQSTVTIAPNSSKDIVLTVTSDPSLATGSYPFTVTAYNSNDSSVTGSAQATLDIAGAPIPKSNTVAYGVVTTLLPSQATVGQGGQARYVVRVTNTGSNDTSFSLSVDGLPQGVYATLGDYYIDIPPGASNFRDVTLVLTTYTGTSVGSFPFTVTATDGGSATGSADGTLVVVNNGVGVSLSPSTGTPGSSFQATVTNTGNVADTFDLALGGPASLVSTLGTTQVTLAPGASQKVSISTGAANFALGGSLGLIVLATSHTNPAVKDGDSADLTIGHTQGLTAQFTPASKTLPQPGATSFLLTVKNTGNVEDTYEAVIMGTHGPVNASLLGLDGLPTQVISLFRLPALGTGLITLNAKLLAALQQGLITVMVRSTSNSAISAVATASVNASATTITATTTRLTVAPAGTVTAGHSVTLSASVHAASGSSVPTGTVTFIDGSHVLGTVTLGGNGLAHLTLPTTGTGGIAGLALALGIGTHHITAVYHGDATHTGSRSNAVALVVKAATPAGGDGPTVTSLLRFGYHVQPTVIVLHFNHALDPGTARNLANYRIVNLGGPGRGGSHVGQQIPIRRAVYDPANLTVTLYPAERLDIHNQYRITALGTQGGIADTAGRLLDGTSSGKPGSNYVALITHKTLAGPTNAAGAILNRRLAQAKVHPAGRLAASHQAAPVKLPARPAQAAHTTTSKVKVKRTRHRPLA